MNAKSWEKYLTFGSVYKHNAKTHWLEGWKTIPIGCDMRMGLK